jgi:hypothetical protein
VREPRFCLLLELVLAACGAAAYARPLCLDILPWGTDYTASGTQGDVKVYRWTELCVQQIGKP